MQKRSYLFLGFVLILGILAGLLFWKFPYKLGLDVKGGVRFTYAIHPIVNSATPTAPGSTPSSPTPGGTPASPAVAPTVNMADMTAKTIQILTNRISGDLGVSDGDVYSKEAGDGPDGHQVIVEMPGYTDTETAQKVIGTSASLKAYFTQTVNPDNSAITYRQFTDIPSTDAVTGYPEVDFQDNFTKRVLKPGDPEYKKMIDGWTLLLQGQDLQKATPQTVGEGKSQPTIEFTPKGGDILSQWSEKYRGQGEKLAFVLDGKVIQIAPVNKNSTLGQQIVIEGQYDPSYVKNLCDLLNAGALPADLKLLSSEKVDPTIGNFALEKMVFAGAIAFGVICLYLILYYGLPGFVASIALSLYCLFTLAILKTLGATFSLAAIAGFVLSVGMAVDANILVFERFKEEIKKGRKLHDALELGFKRALGAIFDSNMCSIITSAVLAYFGTGPVKGFATTLIIGVVISFFTAITVTRSLLFFFTDSGLGNNEKLYALNRNWFGEHLEDKANSEPLQIVNRTRTWFMITASVIVVGIAFLALGGLKFNVDFLGGVEATYVRTADFPSQADILKNLSNSGIKGANIQFSKDQAGNTLANITVPGDGFGGMLENEQNALLVKDAGLPTGTVAKNLSFVGPAIQKETTTNAIYGVVLSFVFIIIYLGFRFGLMLGSIQNGMRFGISAIAAGAKDILVIFGIAAMIGKLLGWEISALFITAMLTVIGFSVHDKIVIFDRIRENLRKPLPDENFEHLCNRSISQSIARSINTAMAVIVTLAILVIFGTTTNDLKFFLIIMLSGIAWGTYSSIFTATPVLYLWEKAIEKKHGIGATLLGTARAEHAKNRIMGHVIPSGPVIPTESGAVAPTAGGGRSYGQVRRRASAVDKASHELDD